MESIPTPAFRDEAMTRPVIPALSAWQAFAVPCDALVTPS
jgi:hypothetical protein